MSHLSRNGVKSEFALHWSKPDEKVMANKRIDTIVKAFSQGKRRQRKAYTKSNDINNLPDTNLPMDLFMATAHNLEVVQLGGNETVGYGLCFLEIY